MTSIIISPRTSIHIQSVFSPLSNICKVFLLVTVDCPTGEKLSSPYCFSSSQSCIAYTALAASLQLKTSGKDVENFNFVWRLGRRRELPSHIGRCPGLRWWGGVRVSWLFFIFSNLVNVDLISRLAAPGINQHLQRLTADNERNGRKVFNFKPSQYLALKLLLKHRLELDI